MPLVVAPDDGWDSLVSLADANAYFAEIGVAAWAAATEGARERALRRGTTYILARRLIPGATSPVVLRQVEEAVFEAAIRVLDGRLYAETVSDAPITEKTVGPLTIKYGAPGSRTGSISVIDDLLVGLTYGGFGGQAFFERV